MHTYVTMFKLKRSYIEKVHLDQIPWRDIVFLLEIALKSKLSALALKAELGRKRFRKRCDIIGGVRITS